MKQFSSDLIIIKQLYKLFENTELLLSFKQECLIKQREQRKKINQINSRTPYWRRFQDLFNYKGYKTNPKTLLSPLWKASTTFPDTRQSLSAQYQKIFFWSKQRLWEHQEIVTAIVKYSWDGLEILTNTFQTSENDWWCSHLKKHVGAGLIHQLLKRQDCSPIRFSGGLLCL